MPEQVCVHCGHDDVSLLDQRNALREALKICNEHLSAVTAEREKLTAALETEKKAVSYLIDSSCHYRNLAIVLGAKPEQMVSENDRMLCIAGINPDETSGGYHISVNQQLGELKETWEELDEMRTELLNAQERIATLQYEVLHLVNEHELAQELHDVAVKERDYERIRANRLERERDEALTSLRHAHTDGIRQHLNLGRLNQE